MRKQTINIFLISIIIIILQGLDVMAIFGLATPYLNEADELRILHKHNGEYWMEFQNVGKDAVAMDIGLKLTNMENKELIKIRNNQTKYLMQPNTQLMIYLDITPPNNTPIGTRYLFSYEVTTNDHTNITGMIHMGLAYPKTIKAVIVSQNNPKFYPTNNTIVYLETKLNQALNYTFGCIDLDKDPIYLIANSSYNYNNNKNIINNISLVKGKWNNIYNRYEDDKGEIRLKLEHIYKKQGTYEYKYICSDGFSESEQIIIVKASRDKGIIYLMVALFLMLLIGGGVWYYYAYAQRQE